MDYDLIFRLLARRCRIPPWEAERLTLRQAINLLIDEGGTDPHAGNIPITNIDQLREIIEGCE